MAGQRFLTDLGNPPPALVDATVGQGNTGLAWGWPFAEQKHSWVFFVGCLLRVSCAQGRDISTAGTRETTHTGGTRATRSTQDAGVLVCYAQGVQVLGLLGDAECIRATGLWF